MKRFFISTSADPFAPNYLRWGFGILSLFLLVLSAAFSWVTWETQKAESARELASLAAIGGKSLDTYFSQLDNALNLLGQQLLEQELPPSSDKIEFFSRRLRLSYPELHDVHIKVPESAAAASGTVDTQFAASALPASLDAQTRQQARISSLDIGVPYASPGEKEWRLPLRYEVRDHQGKLAFVIRVVLPMLNRQAVWQDLSLPADVTIGFLNDDGALLGRYPVPLADSAGNDNPRAIMLADYLKQNGFPPLGQIKGKLADDSDPSLQAFYRLRHYPMTFFAATPMSVVQAAWWKTAQLIYLMAGLLLGGLMLVYRRSMKYQMGWEKAQGRFDQKFRLAAHAIENTMDGIMIIDAEKRIVSVNKGFADITGYAADEVIGQVPRMFQSSRHDQNFYRDLWSKLGKEGHWKGEIWDHRKSGQLYVQLLSLSAVRTGGRNVKHYVGTFSDITQYKDYEACLEFLANHDPLTNLPNRILLNNRLDEALAKAKQNNGLVGVIFIDLDRFKIVNDSLGHEIGDRLLQQVAVRLLATVRQNDTVARLGGDEFTVILDPLPTMEEAALIAEKLLDTLLKPAEIDAHQLYISASIGISCYPQDGSDSVTLLKHADTAMYRAKEEGREKFKFFSSEMNARAKEFMLMANNLRKALERQQLVLEYQPRVNLQTGKIVGAEALIRWDHPELGRISPDRFIPLAEETGLIVPIGEWIIRTACQQGKAWLDAGHPLQVAVNLSVRQFRKPGLIEYILATLRDVEYPVELLEVEITESLMMDDPQSIKETLAELSRHGISIAIDDFGTGYSSLSYLKQFPIDYVKIDQSFVRDTPGDADSVAIVKTIIAMAKSLRLSLIAEGVETEEQRRLLCQEGCEEAQGFYFSRPLPAAQMLPLLIKADISQA